MQPTVTVDLGERSYPIYIGRDLLPRAGELAAACGLSGRCLLVTDSNVDAMYGEPCAASFESANTASIRAVLPAGETSKSMEQLGALYDRALEGGLDRTSFVAALGGGVVGDLAGYGAATYLRGLPYVQLPTTIVAMVDSAVGGKTGINLPQGKNLVGSFWQPAAVIADLNTLASLPGREYRSGLAEVVKYGVIWDAEFFALLETQAEALKQRDPGILNTIVTHSCRIKAEVVRRDEREGGLRAILNFGHTVGHAIEKVTGYRAFLHGEAISAGMVYAAHLSYAEGSLTAAAVERITDLLRELELPVAAPDCEWPALRSAISVDKKSVAARPRFVLADEIGEVRFGCEADEATLEEVWHGLGE
jgi:3-dehydroquinate synthase